MSTKGRRRHSPEQIVPKLCDADAMLNAGKDLAANGPPRVTSGSAASLAVPGPQGHFLQFDVILSRTSRCAVREPRDA